MKTYVLMLAKTFPKGHCKEGQPTDFKNLVLQHQKIHTIRKNYGLWAKRFREVNNGNAIISIREWTAKPYRSKQSEITCLTNLDGISLQKFTYNVFGDMVVSNTVQDIEIIATNDGLTKDDFVSWFKNADHLKTMALIQFTPFAYK